MAYTSKIAEAFAFAQKLHETQQRKGCGAPYLTHLMAVAALVGEYGGTEAQVIAALLHDAVEDQGGPAVLGCIRATFGEEVAGYVSACSDTDVTPKPPWRERKEAFIRRIAGATPEVKLIVAADQLHNTRGLITGLREGGPPFWDQFNGGRDGSLWYRAEMVRALSDGWTHPMLADLADTVDQLHHMAME